MFKVIGRLVQAARGSDSSFGKPGKSVRQIDADTAKWLRAGGIARPERSTRR
ncbi:hypothetical protein [Kitasatospora sp. GP82]|uniref:hypothetical protein n=1 Tax=Kitasatospora sp. GP82 TaxID=3035089 RepID=UPI0024746F64|nr:hypothetical protein [Kitasatospora sp. GP82]MDH6129375.1 hypothetical protein [Kitasatospora sp. GP82]